MSATAGRLPVRVRLEGRLVEVAELADWLSAAPGAVVFNRSRPYPNRGDSDRVRVYLDVTPG